MGLFDGLKNLAMNGINRVSGNTDFLEAVCAGAALVAYADGSCSDDEVASALTSISGSPTLTKAFTQPQIEQTMTAMINRAKTGSVGRIGLRKELTDIANKPDIAEIVFATVVDVASADGNVSNEEKSVIKTIGNQLGINPASFGITL